MFFGPFNVKGRIQPELLTDLDRREYLMLIPLGIAAFCFGIFPQLLIRFIDPFAKDFTEMILATGKALTLTP
jgi:NADH-quinone oxidoreductase subunit M